MGSYGPSLRPVLFAKQRAVFATKTWRRRLEANAQRQNSIKIVGEGRKGDYSHGASAYALLLTFAIGLSIIPAMIRRSFKSGELQRELERRGKSQASFAFAAGVSPSTVFKACRGDDLSPTTWGRLIRALGAIQPLKTSRHS